MQMLTSATDADQLTLKPHIVDVFVLCRWKPSATYQQRSTLDNCRFYTLLVSRGMEPSDVMPPVATYLLLTYQNRSLLKSSRHQ